MYQILSLCKKHGSYTCRATLSNFVGNIPTLLYFVRKIPTHDILCRNNSYKCRNYSYICKNNSYTCGNYSYTARRCLTLCAMCRNLSYKIQQSGNISYKILQKFSIQFYTTVKFLPALYPKIMISYLIWNKLNTDDFRYEGKLSCAITKSTLFAVSKNEWDTKEDTGKYMKNGLYVLRYAKRHLSGQSNVN